MDKSTHQEHLSQPIQTNNKQFKIAVTFPTRYNGVFNVTDKNNYFYFTNSISDEDGFFQIIMTKGAYDLESLYKEIKRIIIDEEHYPELSYPFTIKPSFSALGSIIKTSTKGPIKTFVPYDRLRDHLGFNSTTIFEEYNLSPNPVDILSLTIYF